MAKKWGKIGAPNSKKRKRHLKRIRKKAFKARKRNKGMRMGMAFKGVRSVKKRGKTITITLK